jgi:transcriptional regulator with XRE-family HTH domain
VDEAAGGSPPCPSGAGVPPAGVGSSLLTARRSYLGGRPASVAVVAPAYPVTMPCPAPPWSTAPFGAALRGAMALRGMSFRDLESRCLVPVGNLHDHASGRRRPPGDDLLRRIAHGLGVEPAYFREWRERRLLEALRDVPDLEVWLSRHVAAGGLAGAWETLRGGAGEPGA